MFKNLIVFRVVSGLPSTPANWESALERTRFVPCSAFQEKSVGWVTPRGQEHGPLLEVVAGHYVMKLVVESKVVPGAVVKRKVHDQVQDIEQKTGRKPGKKERRDISEDVRQSLLPMAFSKQTSVWVWVDPQACLLVLDCASQSRADEVLAQLQELPGLTLQLLSTAISPRSAMAAWLQGDAVPDVLHIERECELKATDESKAVVRYSRHSLETPEVRQHIAEGKLPTRLALNWNDRVQFVLTEGMQLKKLSFLESVFEEASRAAGDGQDDRFDTDVVIATGELSQLLPDLMAALGGEDQSYTTAAPLAA